MPRRKAGYSIRGNLSTKYRDVVRKGGQGSSLAGESESNIKRRELTASGSPFLRIEKEKVDLYYLQWAGFGGKRAFILPILKSM